jgi:AraC-like DNA-binding protein
MPVARGIDQCHETVGHFLCENTIDARGRSGELGLHCSVAPLGPGIALAVLHWTSGADVRAKDSGDQHNFVSLSSGRGRMTVAGREIEHVRGKHAVVMTPNSSSRAVTDRAITAICVRVDQCYAESHLRAITGIEPTSGIRFESDMPLVGRAASIWRFVNDIIDEIDHDSSVLHSPIVIERLSDTLMTGLLFAQPHTHTKSLHSPNRSSGPYYVRLAEEFIEGHCNEAIDSQRLAAVTGVSVSALYDGFRRFRSYTPMQFLKSVRLRRARNELLLASPDCTLTRVASKWGFLHLGRFSKEYAELFGEKPADTLRRGHARP